MEKKNDVENILEKFRSYKYNEFKEKLKKLEKERENSNIYTLRDDVKFLAKKNPKDYEIFEVVEREHDKEKREIEQEKAYFQINLLNKLESNEKKEKNNINIYEEEKEEYISNENDISRSDLNESFLDSEDNIIINTKSH